MSYYHGGHPGAVAVSYSASTISPLPPNRRYSGSNSMSVTSRANGSGSQKYTTYLPSNSLTSTGLNVERTSGYYSTSSNTSYRSSSYTSSGSSDILRRTCFLPTKSVASYNETSSIVSTSSLNGTGFGRYGSASSSSASSTTSSNSSTSRDRPSLQNQPTAGSLATTVADLYAIYSPTNYVPNITATPMKAINSNWRHASNNQDDSENFHDRRSYSIESGIRSVPTCNATESITSDHWSTRRDAKRPDSMPVNGRTGSDTVVSENDLKHESSTLPIEVTSENVAVRTGNDAVINETLLFELDNLSDVLKNSTNVKVMNVPKNTLDEITVSIKFYNRDIDNNNGPSMRPKSTSTDCDSLTETYDATVESRRRRKYINDGAPLDADLILNS